MKEKFSEVWISGTAWQKVISALVLSSHYENHIATFGDDVYFNGCWLCSTSDNGARLRFEGVAQLSEPNTTEERAVAIFRERLNLQPQNPFATNVVQEKKTSEC
jgi:hypothetical protein